MPARSAISPLLGETVGGIADHQIVTPLGQQPTEIRTDVSGGVVDDCYTPTSVSIHGVETK